MRLPVLNKNRKKILSNISWLSFDTAVKMIVGLLVGIWTARYLQPQNYGLLNYSTSFVLFFSFFLYLSYDDLVIKKLVTRSKPRIQSVLGAAFLLKMLGGVIILLLATAGSLLVRPGDYLTLSLIAIIASGYLLQPFHVIIDWYQSRTQSKYAVIPKIISFLLSSGIKVVLILLHASVIWFAAIITLELLLGALGLLWIYHRQGHSFFAWRYSIKTMREIFRESLPFVVAWLPVLICSRIDQVMIGKMLNDYSVGIYAAATRLCDVPVALLGILNASLFPTLAKMYKNNKTFFMYRFTQITTVYTGLALGVILVTFFLAKPIVLLLYGNGYQETTPLLLIQILALLFIFNGGLRNYYLVLSNNASHIIVFTASLAAILNISLNFWLIPLWGPAGAAWATVFTQGMSLLIANIFFKETRQVFYAQLKSLFIVPVVIAYIRSERQARQALK